MANSETVLEGARESVSFYSHCSSLLVKEPEKRIN
jgi:hypothetical protein